MICWRRAILGVLALAAAVMPPAAARAAGPVALGAGHLATVDLDPGGTAYIAWDGNESNGSTLQYCRLPAAATSCDVRLALPVPGDSVTRPFVAVNGSVVRVLQYRFGLTNGLTPDQFAAVYLFTSTDGGATFDSGSQVGTVPFTEAVTGPGGGVSLVTNAETQGEFYQRVPTDGSAPVTTAANLSTDHPYVGTVALLDPATPLAVFDDGSGNAQFRRYSGAGDPNDAASWTPAQDIGHADRPHLAGGPSGVFLLDTSAGGGIEVRKFTGSGFGGGVAIPDGTGENAQDHLTQDPAGMLHVLLPQIGASGYPLLYAYSQDGRSWTTTHFQLGGLATQVWSAFGPDHHGIAVWYSGNPGTVFALRLAPTTPAAVVTTVSAALGAAASAVSHTDPAAAARSGRINLQVAMRTAGTLTMGMVAQQSVHIARTVKKGTVLARGRVVAKHAGKVRLVLRLTAAGRSALRKLGRTLGVKLMATFVPPQGAPYAKSRGARIRPRHHASTVRGSIRLARLAGWWRLAALVG